MTGHVLATANGAPLAGVTITPFGLSATTTDASGLYSLTLVPTSSSILFTLSSPNIVTRQVVVSATSHDNTIDAFQLDGRFDLTFYRMLARNQYDAPGSFASISHVTKDVNIYLRTVDDAGTAIDQALLDATANTITNYVSTITASKYHLTSLVRGTSTMEGVSGWRTVKWLSTVPSDKACARSLVGTDGGWIELDYKTGGGCSCGNIATRPRTVKHELGHSLAGLFHTDSQSDLMSGIAVSGCDQELSQREAYHLPLVMARPNGNTDPDNDPAVVTLFRVSEGKVVVD